LYITELWSENLEQQYTGFTKDGTFYRLHNVSTEGDSPLIFIHGVGMNSSVWSPQIEHFSTTYKVITYDFIGHGCSSKPEYPLNLDDYVEQLHELVRHLNISVFSLVGHSMGALIGVAFALKYPNMVKLMVALNMVFNREQEAQDRVLERAEKVISSGKIVNVEETLSRWFKYTNNHVDSNKINEVREFFKELSPKSYGQAYKLFALSDKLFINSLSKLSMPVMYLTGEDDYNSTAQMSSEMAKLTPKGVSMALSGEAHMMSYISAEKVNSVITKFMNYSLN